MKNWLLRGNSDSGLTAILWNAMGSGLIAGQAAILLVFVARAEPLEVAGMLSIAYAIANVFYALARYGVRNYQVTDVREEYTFGDYRLARVITTSVAVIMALALALFGMFFSGYGTEKGLLIIAVCLLKVLDAVEDLYTARYQQTGHFVTGAKMCALRQGLVTGVMCVAVAMGAGVCMALGIGLCVGIALLILLVRTTWSVAEVTGGARLSKSDRVRKLLAQCFSLCVGTTIAIYVGNMPKYAIDLYLDEGTQAVFGYIMLPVFVIALLSQFLYQPFVKSLGELWDSSDYRGFGRAVGKQCLIVSLLALVVVAACVLLGLPMLSVVYGVELGGFRAEFLLLMLGGALYALASYLAVPITAARAQRSVAWGYGIAAICSIATQGVIVPSMGMMGAAVLYVLSNAILLVTFTISLLLRLRKTKAS